MQPQNSQQALAALQQSQSQAQNPNDILSGQRQQLGVNAAQDTVTGLRGAINNTTKMLTQVAPSVMGRTGNSLVTNAQAGKIIQNEQAPINQTLSDQTTKYGQAGEDYNRLEQNAEQAASGVYQGQQDKLSYAQNLYNALYQKEQDAQAEADRQQARQDALKAAAAGSGGFTLSGGGGGGLPAAAGAPAVGAKSVQRSGGGFNFTDAGGKAINAAQYAQATGTPFRAVLQEMANHGDTGAKTALQFVGNDFGYDPRKITSPQLASLYTALTGRKATVYQAPQAYSPPKTVLGINNPLALKK